jgi:hypothetical protein
MYRDECKDIADSLDAAENHLREARRKLDQIVKQPSESDRGYQMALHTISIRLRKLFENGGITLGMRAILDLITDLSGGKEKFP